MTAWASSPRIRPPDPCWEGEDREGRPLLVREAEPRDAGRFVTHTQDLVTDTDWMLQCGRDPVPDPDNQRHLLRWFHRSETSLVIIATRPDLGPGREEILGSVTLTGGGTQRTRHVVQLGMGVRRFAWGLGIGGRLLDVAVSWCRAHQTVTRLELQVFSDNQAALGLYAGRGFAEEGVLRNEAILEDGPRDLVAMGLWTGP